MDRCCSPRAIETEERVAPQYAAARRSGGGEPLERFEWLTHTLYDWFSHCQKAEARRETRLAQSNPAQMTRFTGANAEKRKSAGIT